MIPKTALQLYSVRDVIAKKDYESVVRQVAEIGYSGVETDAFPGTTPQAAGKLFKGLGMAACSIHHFPVPGPAQKAEVLDVLGALDCKFIVSGGGPDNFKTVDAIKRIADQFNQAAAMFAAHGVRFGVHNHWWEYLKINDQGKERYAYEVLLDLAAPEVTFQLDTYWIKTAGVDPAAITTLMGKRSPLLHIKDGPAVKNQPQTAVGDGKLDFQAIAKAGAGITEWMIVELDACATDMVEAVRKSYQYLTSKGLASGRK